jgi:AraC-like DNA-binding protein
MAVIRRHSVMRDRLVLPQDSSPTERDSCEPPTRVVNGFLMNGAEMLLWPGHEESATTLLDAAYQAGYADQSHMTRSLKHFIGHTPAQIAQIRKPK